MSQAAVVSVCIPAYQAAAFIDRTLRCARDQTYEAQRVLVSIDLCDDATAEICRSHAAEDSRLEVFVQPERLGWAGNVNFLLDQVDSEFAFIYFHDDLIKPEYSARLVAALSARPDAASAHCDVGHFGGSDKVIRGRGMEGTAAVRIVDLLTGRTPSMPRSMLRTELAGHVRLSTEAKGIWAHQPFVMGLVAAGPVLHVPEALYSRWDHRDGGLTEGWLALPFDEILAGHRANAQTAMQMIDAMEPSPEERETMLFALLIHATRNLRRAEGLHDAAMTPAEDLLPQFARMTVPQSITTLPLALQAQCEAAYERVQRRTRKRSRELARSAQTSAQ